MSGRKEIAAVVLAAGLSSRMGALKPLLPLGDDIVLGRVIAAARHAGVEHIHVVVGHRAEEIVPHVIRLGATPVSNPAFRTGMLSSIKAGIASLDENMSGCLLMPADIPLVRPASVTRILEEARHGGAVLVHPVFRGERGHPPFIARELFSEILAADDTEGACTILARHENKAVEVAVFDEGCLRDMDTPRDHRALDAALVYETVPSEAECLAMFEAAGTPVPVRRHGRAVADLALALATALNRAGLCLDIPRIRAAALLHDIAKGRAHHAAFGAQMIRTFGFPALSAIIEHHMALPARPSIIDETAVVYLADKLVAGEKQVTLEQRFAPALKRFAADETALAGARRRLADAVVIARLVEAAGVCLSLANPRFEPATGPSIPVIREIAS
ncbi:CTP:molybdopterin cytidylyltransferase MocA [Breoghania corrubedonensis]|uniref:CTP:molybdopterin cytidylyltransferase MocA n=1 Tax=Breoghania corrubedonensis TaxID=665038 RepID=A0A2T5VGI3_9HYPH|nr:NTP transferase domain-containing protein [Breoghania corrubedonensis]PTW62848.1 CTP:molybdopterin cytidylyltransferase MocA [Breoghania corrubedonensis]